MVSRKAGGGKGPKKPSSVTKAYLLLYNGVLTLGWAVSYEISFKDVSTFALSSLVSIGPHCTISCSIDSMVFIALDWGKLASQAVSFPAVSVDCGQLGMLSHVSALAKSKAVRLVWLLCSFACAVHLCSCSGTYHFHISFSWTFLLVKTIQYTLTHWQNFNGYVPHLYDEIRWPLQVFQTAALLEVIRT